MSDTPERVEEGVAEVVRDVVTWPGWWQAWGALPWQAKATVIAFGLSWLTGYTPAQVLGLLNGVPVPAPCDTDAGDTP